MSSLACTHKDQNGSDCADICPIDEPLGEISLAAAVCLGGKSVSPRTGVDFPGNGDIHCCILKNSRRAQLAISPSKPKVVGPCLKARWILQMLGRRLKRS